MATAAEAQKRAREYETIYVLRQDVDPDTADKVASRVAEVVARENGTLVKVETWGRRKLAYVVAKQRRGVYYYLKYLGGGAVVTELERNLRMLDNVLKFQTVLLRDDVADRQRHRRPRRGEVLAHRGSARKTRKKSRARRRSAWSMRPKSERPRHARANSATRVRRRRIGTRSDWAAPVAAVRKLPPKSAAPLPARPLLKRRKRRSNHEPAQHRLRRRQRLRQNTDLNADAPGGGAARASASASSARTRP